MLQLLAYLYGKQGGGNIRPPKNFICDMQQKKQTFSIYDSGAFFEFGNEFIEWCDDNFVDTRLSAQFDERELKQLYDQYVDYVDSTEDEE